VFELKVRMEPNEANRLRNLGVEIQ
jgi:hypothetical protein